MKIKVLPEVAKFGTNVACIGAGIGIGTAICPGIGTIIGGALGWLAGLFIGNSIKSQLQKHYYKKFMQMMVNKNGEIKSKEAILQNAETIIGLDRRTALIILERRKRHLLLIYHPDKNPSYKVEEMNEKT